MDDKAVNVRLVEKMLVMTGYSNVLCTQDPVEVLPLCQKHSIDLMLLDLDMPILDGYGVLDQLKSLKEENPLPRE